ncbi:MAG: DUF2088 domain-containing protein [Deltaproteobacteria bacterium]|nr:DUF2088 domain-containing protein [Deltaproteobacteria bacterium]MBW1960531.1 DUF2088 domain-containing protein [Deltaproteobacteria bacterium]MBW1994421.1 DUF2088 domain-containing protein [Deltaproteobacteria bacterium]MBW2150678.1 DUF2088 domain-containing protein [Deltaproteobacteria bacterium]
MKFPEMYRIQQTFKADSIKDIEAAVRGRFSKLKADTRPGDSVAIAVGSRGIHDLQRIVRAVVSCLKERRLSPFIIPAMGSHGGATAEGQKSLLKNMGIHEDAVGAPIISTMDVVSLGKLSNGTDVFFSKDALEAEHIVVLNRIKPHTLFRRPVESGLCKMLVIGCGKHRGAEAIHGIGVADAIVPAAETILEKAPVLCGIAVLENAKGGTQDIQLAMPESFVEIDQRLLKEAWKLFPKIPVDDLDILIVDEIGKDISGGGMDPNVIGFWRRDGGPREPDYRTLIVLDITAPSHGNAMGIGWADLTTRRVKDQIDYSAMYMNAITSGVFRAARVPIALENDRAAIETALSKLPEPAKARMVRIKNTLDLETFWASKALLPELREREGINAGVDPVAFQFDNTGRLRLFE